MQQVATNPAGKPTELKINTISLFHTLGALYAVEKEPKCIENKKEFLDLQNLIRKFRRILPRDKKDTGSIVVNTSEFRQANVLIKKYGTAADIKEDMDTEIKNKQRKESSHLKLVS